MVERKDNDIYMDVIYVFIVHTRAFCFQGVLI
jgi:hypothetical protein